MNNRSKSNYTAILKSTFLVLLAFAIVYKLPVILLQMEILANGIILWGSSVGLIMAFLYVVSDTNEDNYNSDSSTELN